MAKEKKSLLSWLTGDAGADADYSFDDLESGSSLAPASGRKLAPKRSAAIPEPAPAVLEEEEAADGELSVDVYQTPTHIIIKAMIAGVKPEDLDVSITRDMVTPFQTSGGAQVLAPNWDFINPILREMFGR